MPQEKRDRSTKKPGFSCFYHKFLANSEKKPGFSVSGKVRSLNQETGFLMFSAKCLADSEKKPGFSYPRKSAIAQPRNRVSDVFTPNF
jgi:hypothetical protein